MSERTKRWRSGVAIALTAGVAVYGGSEFDLLPSLGGSETSIGRPVTPAQDSKWAASLELDHTKRQVIASNPTIPAAFSCILNAWVKLRPDQDGSQTVMAAGDGTCSAGSVITPGQINPGLIARLEGDRNNWDTMLQDVQELEGRRFVHDLSMCSGTERVTAIGMGDISTGRLALKTLYDGKHAESNNFYGPAACLIGESATDPKNGNYMTNTVIHDLGTVPYGAGTLALGLITSSSGFRGVGCPLGAIVAAPVN